MRAEDPSRSLDDIVDCTELFGLLESKDSHIVEEVKALIRENLNNSRDTWLLFALVDYYMTTQSERCMEIMIGLREPHDKHLFDKLADSLKSGSHEQALNLLGHLVRKHPSWLHKIADHKVMTCLLQLLKVDCKAPTLMNGLLIIVTLLPFIPSLVAPNHPHLEMIFDIFSRLCAWSTKKPGNVPEVYFLHLKVALYALFHRLYSMYPCNFLAYLRWHYGGRDESRDNIQSFNDTIKPMLERVRLHPLLVTASKETELSAARWKNLEPHDIIVQCAKLSLDENEAALEASSSHSWMDASQEVSHPASVGSSGSRPTSHLETYKQVPIEAGSLMAEMVANLGPSPLCISDLSPSSTNQELETSLSEAQASSAAYVEDGDDSKTDLFLSQDKIDSKKSDSHSGSSQEKNLRGLNTDSDVVQAEEAHEEAHSKPEINEKSSPPKCQFLSTTDTLTTSAPCRPEISGLGALSPPGPLPLNCSTNEGGDKIGEQVSSDPSQVLIERLVHGINRLRFFSHCGHPPDIPLEWLRRSSALKKSYSWPNLVAEGPILPRVTSQLAPEGDGSERVSPAKSIPEVEINDVPSPKEFPIQVNLNWKNAAHSGGPLPEEEEGEEEGDSKPINTRRSSSIPISESDEPDQSKNLISIPGGGTQTKFSTLSPMEILDRHLQLGSEIYMKELKTMSLASMKDTDWTHFGGPPPADELNILHGQITLLHMQLLFERHRREVHAERNRRLLGKAKKSRALEEQNLAMKDQLRLQEKEIQHSIEKQKELILKLDEQSKDTDLKDLHKLLKKQMQENHVLESSIRELKLGLENEKLKNEALAKDLDKTRGELTQECFQNRALSEQTENCKRLEEKVKLLTCRLAVVQEVQQRHMDKELFMPKSPEMGFEYQQLKESASYEIEELKMSLRTQRREMDTSLARIENLEEQVSNKNLVIDELKELLESVKSSNGELLRSKEDHIVSLQRIVQCQEEKIMEMKHTVCLQERAQRPAMTSLFEEDASLSYPRHWPPAQTELDYELSIQENGNADVTILEATVGGETTVLSNSENNASGSFQGNSSKQF